MVTITVYPHTGTLTTPTYQQSPVHWPLYPVYVWLGAGYCGRTTTWPSWVSSLHATTFDPSEDLARTDWVLPTTSTALLWHWVPPRAVSERVVVIAWLGPAFLCMNDRTWDSSLVHEWSDLGQLSCAWIIGKPHLPLKKASLQSKPLNRHVLTNTRSCSTVLGWPGVWDCYLMQYYYICQSLTEYEMC